MYNFYIVTCLFFACLFPSKLVWAQQALATSNDVVTFYIPERPKKSLLSISEHHHFSDYQRELFTEVAKIQGIPYQFVQAPLNDILTAIRNGERAIATSLPYLAAQDSSLLYTVPYLELSVSEFQRNNLPKNPTIAVAQKEYDRLSKIVTDSTILTYKNTAELYQIIEQQKPGIIRASLPKHIRQKLQQLNIENDYTEFVDTHNKSLLRAAGHRQYRDLLIKVNQGLRTLTQGQLELLAERHLVVFDGEIKERLSLLVPGLSRAEQDYIIDTPKVSYLAFKKNSEPFVLVDKTRLQGYWLDILNQISLRTGLVFEGHFIDDIKSSYIALQQNEVDILPGIIASGSLEQKLIKTVPYDRYTQQIVSRYQNSYANLEALRNKRVATIKGVKVGQIVRAKYPNINVLEYDNFKQALLDVASGKIDALLGNSLAISFQANQLGLTNLNFASINSLKNIHFNVHMATMAKNQNLLGLLNKGLKLTSKSTLNAFKNKWNEFYLDTIAIEQNYRKKLTVIGLALVITILFAYFAFIYSRRSMRKEQKQHQETLNMLAQVEQARQQVVSANKAQSYFFARMTHEIRTPLNGLFGMAEALAMSDLNPQQAQNLKVLQQSGKTLVAILDDILDFSKLDSGKLNLSYKATDIEQLINSCLASFAERAKAKKIDLRLIMNCKLSQAYMVDPLRLTQVMNNLVSNSLKFTEQGSVLVKVDKAPRENQGLIISVCDTGIGIAKSDLTQIFSVYEQATNNTGGSYGGTGLGLSICKELVHKMNGHIEVESEPNKGTQFSIYLPLRGTDNKPEEFIEKSQQETTALPKLSSVRMLMAEDNLVNQKVLQEQLKLFDIYPDIANNGQEAWQLYQENDYDFVLSDCHMPIMDGFELAKLITQADKPKTAKLIAITADALNGSNNACIEAGFDDYLLKPINRFQLAAALTKTTASNINSAVNEQDESEQLAEAKQQLGLQVINPLVVADVCGNDKAIIQSTLTVFLENQQEFAQLIPLINEHQLEESINCAHKLKGNSKYLGAVKLSEYAHLLEDPKLNHSQRLLIAELAIAELEKLTTDAKLWLKQLKGFND